MKNKKQTIIATSAALLSLLFIAASISNGSFARLLQNTSATNNHVLNLNSSTQTGLGNEYGNGTFDTLTSDGNTVTWSYNYAKASEGNLVELGKNEIGISPSSKFCIGNTSPITSITSISIVIGNDDHLLVYGSNDNSTFYKLDYLSKSSALNYTGANQYHYLRLSNGYQADTSMVISSITINYDCLNSDYTDELSDISSKEVLKDSDNLLSSDSDVLLDGFQSKRSLKILGHETKSTYDFSISLGKEIPSSEIVRYNLQFYVNTLNNTNYDSSHKYMRFLIYPGVGSGRNSKKLYIQPDNINNGLDWTVVNVDFSTLTEIQAGETINSLYIRCVYIKDYVNVDQVRIYLNEHYPEIDQNLYNIYESSDVSNSTVHFGYGTVKSGFVTSTKSNNSLQSSRITIDADYRMWYYENGAVDADCSNYTVQFDINVIPQAGKSHGNLSFSYQYLDGDDLHVYTVSSILSSSFSATGVTKTDLGNGFYRITIDFKAHHDSVEGSTKVSTNVGFNVGNSREIYVDNYFVSTVI